VAWFRAAKGRQPLVCCGWLCVLGLVAGLPVWGQEVTATILGRVTDSKGAVLPEAKVVVTDVDTHQQIRAVTTSRIGEFTATLLPVGHYSVRVTRTGFEAAVQTGIDLHVGDRLNVEFVMKPGSVDQTVTVTADALQTQTQTSASDMLISQNLIKELSINNRNFLGLLAILPGVTSTSASDELTIGAVNPTGSVNSLPYSLNGGRVSANSYLLDGSDNLDRGANTTLVNTPSVDAIQEFKVIRGVYSAEFGRNAAAQINVITRQGASQVHGDVYEFFRNDVLAANNAENKLRGIARPPLRYNDFGGSIGGPVFIPHVLTREQDKMFFFFSEEARRIIQYPTTSGLAPTAAMKAGQFANPVCVSYSDAAGTKCTATATSITNFDPVAAAYLKDVYDKLPSGSTTNYTLVTVERAVYNLHQELGRVDYAITPQESLTARYIHDAINTQEPYGYQVNDLLPSVATTATQSPGGNAMVRLTSVLRPSLLNEAAFAFTSGRKYSIPIGLLAKSNATDVHVNLPFLSTDSFVPALSMTGLSAVKSYGTYNNYSRNYNFFDNVTLVSGRQTLKFGVTYNYYQKTENNASTNAGAFSFSTTTIPAGGATSAEQTWANFLLGTHATFTQTSLDLTPDIRQSETEMYAQDDYRVLSRLTMNAGIRYSIFRQPYDNRNMLSNFDPYKFVAANAPQITATGTIVAGTGDPLNGIIVNNATSPYGNKVANEPGGKFSPRLGFAWNVFPDGRTALRGGYGLVWDSTLVGIYENNIFTNAPYLNNLSVPNTTFANPAPNAVTSYSQALRGTPLPTRLPYTSQYSLDLQQQIGASFLMDIGYYGSKGTHLLGIEDINTLHPGQYAALTGSTAALTTGTTPAVNAYRPYPGYTAINVVENAFGSNYNSLQVSLEKRIAGGSTLRLAYTWQKTLTDSGTDRNNAPQDHYDPRAEYAVAPFNRKQILVLSYVYKIPFRSQSRFAQGALSGWELSGTTSFDSGLATQVTSGSGSDPAQLGVEGTGSLVTLRPDRIGDPNKNAPHTLLQWFNTAAYKDVPSGQLRVGDAGATSLVGPGFEQWDISVFRNFVFTHRWGGQFRVESFNSFNHTNPQGLYASTDVTTAGSAFGSVASVREPRRIQLAAKITF